MKKAKAIIGNFRVVSLILLNDLGLLDYSSKFEKPFTVGLAKTKDIEYITGRDSPHKTVWSDSGTIKGGNWDQSEQLFTDNSEWYESFIQRYEEGQDWKDTKAFKRREEKIKNGGELSGKLSSTEDLLDYCQDMDGIYEDIKNNGYKIQPEINGKASPKGRKILPFKNKYHEVAVDVSRDGDLLFVDGRHRLAFAKLLNVEKIPVRTVVRHEEFVRNNREIEIEPISHKYGHPLIPNI
ncbi:ParB N-terminal domain-containing protein [Natronorubrum bangense]|uniref:hypothetical protein n=1 Tax=Natronorubrum bangense TaxID=61858 RepID=UPI001267F372|nr:hypothetical protein [Natronorubrum bangense]